MNGFSVECLTFERIGEVVKLDELCFSQPWSAESFGMLCDGKNVGFVALDTKGSVVGFGGMFVVLDEGQITNIAVHPDFRRKGIGEKILSSLLEYAKENELVSISLEVREGNEAAKALYKKIGFEAAGIRKNFYSFPIENAIVMIKNIG